MLLKNVRIHNRYLTDTETGQFFDNITTQTAAAHDSSAAAKQAQLLSSGYGLPVSLVADR
jgi:hypothetical protein